MIFGESAGGFSTSFHLVSKASFGLYSSAIMQSNPIVECQPLLLARALGEYVATNLGCASSNLTCLQAVPAHKLKTLSPAFVLATVDNTTEGLEDYPLNLFLK